MIPCPGLVPNVRFNYSSGKSTVLEIASENSLLCASFDAGAGPSSSNCKTDLIPGSHAPDSSTEAVEQDK